MYEDYLRHYGTKGMHWGIRKDRKSKSLRRYRSRKSPIRRTVKKGYEFVKENKYELLTIGLSMAGLYGTGVLVTIGRRVAHNHADIALSSIK